MGGKNGEGELVQAVGCRPAVKSAGRDSLMSVLLEGWSVGHVFGHGAAHCLSNWASYWRLSWAVLRWVVVVVVDLDRRWLIVEFSSSRQFFSQCESSFLFKYSHEFLSDCVTTI